MSRNFKNSGGESIGKNSWKGKSEGKEVRNKGGAEHKRGRKQKHRHKRERERETARANKRARERRKRERPAFTFPSA